MEGQVQITESDAFVLMGRLYAELQVKNSLIAQYEQLLGQAGKELAELKGEAPAEETEEGETEPEPVEEKVKKVKK